jgi:hypothetical protein
MKTTVHETRPEIPGRLIAAGGLITLAAITMLVPIFWGVAPLALVPLLVFGLPGYLLVRQSKHNHDPTEVPRKIHEGRPAVHELSPDERL